MTIIGLLDQEVSQSIIIIFHSHCEYTHEKIKYAKIEYINSCCFDEKVLGKGYTLSEWTKKVIYEVGKGLSGYIIIIMK